MTNDLTVATPAAALVPTNVEQALHMAEQMAQADLVPQHLQGKPGNCLMVVEQSMRWQMSAFAVAQCTAVVRGKLMYEGKLVAGVINALGPKYGLQGRLRYDYEGEGPHRKVTVSAPLDGRTEAIELELAKAQTQNECWKRQPDQQLAYAGARVWARRYMPELMLGIITPEDRMMDEPPMRDVTPTEPTGEVVADPLFDMADTIAGNGSEAEGGAASAQDEAPASAMPPMPPELQRTAGTDDTPPSGTPAPEDGAAHSAPQRGAPSSGTSNGNGGPTLYNVDGTVAETYPSTPAGLHSWSMNVADQIHGLSDPDALKLAPLYRPMCERVKTATQSSKSKTMQDTYVNAGQILWLLEGAEQAATLEVG